MTDELLEEILRARAAKRAVVLATWLPDGEQRLLDPEADPASSPDAELLGAAHAAAHDDRSAAVEIGGREVFLQVFNPPLRMVIVGAVHVAQSLVSIAGATGFDVVVVDPRQVFATASRFPGVALSHDWPDVALTGLGLDRRTAVVALSHDPKIDEPALAVALRSPAFFVGALGSRKTQAARAARLAERGLAPDEIARLKGPVGLSIGARTTAEIAVSIQAQVIEQLRKPLG